MSITINLDSRLPITDNDDIGNGAGTATKLGSWPEYNIQSGGVESILASYGYLVFGQRGDIDTLPELIVLHC